ncbi:hypothetical protein KI385_41765 [Streptomyces inhibens]|nr:hypothetical protein [Streptomyces inhibens]UKY54686.1 hypothetical protein KI385_41765 [Streptomyces inhibens]
MTVGPALIVFLVTAHFAEYTYVRPFLEEHTGLTPAAIALLLLVHGVFGLLGNVAAGALAARRARVSPTTGISTTIVLLALSAPSSASRRQHRLVRPGLRRAVGGPRSGSGS